jgi:hypothetical protein
MGFSKESPELGILVRLALDPNADVRRTIAFGDDAGDPTKSGRRASRSLPQRVGGFQPPYPKNLLYNTLNRVFFALLVATTVSGVVTASVGTAQNS